MLDQRDICVSSGSACNSASLKPSYVLEAIGLPEDEIIDFVFIDANKSQYIEYFNLLDKHLKKGAVICADNVTSHAEKVKPFLDAINGNPKYQMEVLDLPAGLAVTRKNSD